MSTNLGHYRRRARPASFTGSQRRSAPPCKATIGGSPARSLIQTWCNSRESQPVCQGQPPLRRAGRRNARQLAARTLQRVEFHQTAAGGSQSYGRRRSYGCLGYLLPEAKAKDIFRRSIWIRSGRALTACSLPRACAPRSRRQSFERHPAMPPHLLVIIVVGQCTIDLAKGEMRRLPMGFRRRPSGRQDDLRPLRPLMGLIRWSSRSIPRQNTGKRARRCCTPIRWVSRISSFPLRSATIWWLGRSTAGVRVCEQHEGLACIPVILTTQRQRSGPS